MYRQTHRRPTQASLFIAVLSWCLVQDASAQIGLTSPLSSSMTQRSGGGVLALSLTAHDPKQAASSLLTKLSDRQLPSQRSASTRESEIAAIFRGVAYGAPTFSSNTSTQYTPAPPIDITTTTTSAAPSTTTSFINSVQDPVRSELMRHQIGKESEFVMTTRTVPSVIEVNADSIPYVLHEDDSFRDTSYPYPTPDKSILNKEIPKFPTFHPISEESIILNQNHAGGIREKGILSKSDVKWALGAAWWIHVYVSAGLFALIAAASLCCLARLSPATHVLTRLRYIILLALVFLAAILRCLHLFHDPYGIENRLPDFLTAIIEEISWPCFIAAVAVVALSLYQSSRCSRVFPKSLRLRFALVFFTTAHIIISITAHLVASLVEKYAFPLRVTAQSLAVIWGSFAGFCSLWAVWKAERSAGRYSGHLLGRLNRSATDDLVSSGQTRSSVNCGAVFILVASVGQIMLSALHFYIMLAPVSPTKHIWVWWGRVSMARGLELIISIAVLAAAFIFTSGRPSHSKQESTIFSVLTSCGRDNKNMKGGRSANVFPIQNEKRQILGGSFNFHTSKPSMNDGIKRMPIDWTYTTPRCANKTGTIDSVTSDFQLLWNRDRTQSAASFRPSSMLVNDSGFVRFRTQVDPEQAMDEVFNKSSLNLHNASTPIQYTKVHNYSTQTLPNSKYYCKPNASSLSSPERTPLRNPIRAQTIRAQRSRPDYLRHHMRNRTMSNIRDKSTWTPVSSASKYDVRTLDKYEVASYYNNSIISNNSNMYSTPHTVSPSHQYLPSHNTQHRLPEVHGTAHHYEEARYLKPPSVEGVSGILEPSTCSSLSEIHVDYLTDVSSSNDCMNQHSLPFINCSKRDQSMLTLPLSSTHTSYAQSVPTYTAPMGRTPPSHLPDITPDSAVILDYSTSAETEEEGDKDCRNKSLDLIKISSNSLNDVLKGQARAGLLSKIVGNSMNVSCYGYSPLDVEDTSSPSQEDSSMSRIRRVASYTDLGDAKEVPKTPATPPPVYSKPPNTVTSL
ncbi:uncharacterized protein [Palaemon carinicauda]|uniref:uncharacterized protein n=1 Tax=Palaemon carinicauda TaxID=392227 RepID=UPI0035B63034